MWILLAILALPIIEIALFVQFGPILGVLGTLAEVALSGVLGVLLLKAEPHRNAQDLRAALEKDQSPTSKLAHSALRAFGAVLLVLPGFFTDFIGLLLLLAPVRALILVRLTLAVRNARARSDSVIIEGEYDYAAPREPDPQRQIDDRKSGPEKRD